VTHDDPDFRQIRLEFLAYVRRFHQEHGYTTDWKQLCQQLGILIQAATSNQYVRLKGNPIICYNADDPINRQIFTGLHELSHHLFATADEGFAALLKDKYDEETAKKLEEELCNEAASLLLFPDHVLQGAVDKFGYGPETVFELTKRPASRAAALMRLTKAQTFDWWSLVMTQAGSIEFGCTTSRFGLRKNYVIERSHRIHEAWHGPLEIAAAIPYSSGKRNVKCLMRAGSDGKRVVAFFAITFPSHASESQTPLFLIH
jgi:hypothetical protein